MLSKGVVLLQASVDLKLRLDCLAMLIFDIG